MKLSLCSANYGKTDLKKIIFRAAELGFDGIELTVMFHVPPTLTLYERKEIVEWLKEARISCSALHFIFDKSVKLSNLTKEDTEHSISFLKSIVDLANDLGAPTIIVGGGGTRSTKEGQSKEQLTNHLVHILKAVGSYALDKNIVLAMEALNRYETNYIRTLKDASEFVNAVQLPNMRIMGDTFHMNIEEESIDAAIINYGYQLSHLHLADSNRLAPGTGHTDFKKVVQALKSINFQGYCSFEVFYISPDLIHFDSYDDADSQMVMGMNHMRQILNNL